MSTKINNLELCHLTLEMSFKHCLYCGYCVTINEHNKNESGIINEM